MLSHGKTIDVRRVSVRKYALRQLNMYLHNHCRSVNHQGQLPGSLAVRAAMPPNQSMWAASDMVVQP